VGLRVERIGNRLELKASGHGVDLMRCTRYRMAWTDVLGHVCLLFQSTIVCSALDVFIQAGFLPERSDGKRDQGCDTERVKSGRGAWGLLSPLLIVQ